MKILIPKTSRGGFALVATLLMITVITGAAVAFFQSTRVERVVSRNYSDLARARIAAESGLALASALLRVGTANDHFLVVLNPTNGQLFLGNGSNQPPGVFAYQPLYSFSTNLSNQWSTNYTTNGVPSYRETATTNRFTNTLAGGLVVTSPPVAWIILTNSSGQTNARFAFWVEDLGGRLDLGVAGSTGTNARRPTGTNPAELALWSLFNPGAAKDPENAVVASLTKARASLLSPATARLVDSTNVTTNLLADLAAGMIHDTNEPQLVPYGFGYVSNGQAKLNLNTTVTKPDAVKIIADQINNNLPDFRKRGGGMPEAAYLNNLAASIVDYIDPDSNPTVDDPNDPSYLGIENLPWPNELFDQIQFISVTSAGLIRIELKDWIEVWNMGNTAITTQPTLSISNSYDLILTFTNTVVPTASFRTNLNKMTLESGSWNKREFKVTGSLQPNEYRVLESSDADSTRRLAVQIENRAGYATATIRRAWRIHVREEDETSAMSFQSFVGGTRIQRSKDGRWPRYLAKSTPLNVPPADPDKFIFCNPVGFASQTVPSSMIGKPWHSGGDPRAQLFLSGPLRSQNYTNKYASPGGRNWESTNLARFPESEVNPGKFWGDGGHITNSDRGGLPGSYDQNPATFSTTAQTNFFVMMRNDTGTMTNIAELGNIYDPMQWSDQTDSPAEGQPGLWIHLSASASADTRFGGRNTLRIGRAEHPRFNSDGLRANQLLDLYSAGTNFFVYTTNNAQGAASSATNQNILVNRPPGRINLNTATTNTLRALAAGVVLAGDPLLLPDGTNYTVPPDAVSDFVTGMTNFRAQRPFFSTTELTKLTNAITVTYPTNAIFGNAALLKITEWNDSAAEEWFRKIYPLTSVRSRNFLIYSVGQAMSTNNNFASRPLATSRQVFQVYAEPVRDTQTGLTTNVVVRKINSWSY